MKVKSLPAGQRVGRELVKEGHMQDLSSEGESHSYLNSETKQRGSGVD